MSATPTILDTNVISETFRARPAASVIAWLATLDPDTVFLTSVTEAELRYGAAILPKGRRRTAVERLVDETLTDDFAGRILAFDSAAAVAYADIAARGRAIGRPMAAFDAQIAAIARSRGCVLATRNLNDFTNCGVDLVDPWTARV